jgi:hypothetical protein
MGILVTESEFKILGEEGLRKEKLQSLRQAMLRWHDYKDLNDTVGRSAKAE